MDEIRRAGVLRQQVAFPCEIMVGLLALRLGLGEAGRNFTGRYFCEDIASLDTLA
jgi:hypothetical protein